jgi:hypothetical protein
MTKTVPAAKFIYPQHRAHPIFPSLDNPDISSESLLFFRYVTVSWTVQVQVNFSLTYDVAKDSRGWILRLDREHPCCS